MRPLSILPGKGTTWLAALAVLIGSGDICRAESPQGSTLRLTLVGQLNSADPHEDHTIMSETVFASVCEKLVEFDAEGQLQPGLAVAWHQITPTTTRFELRPDVRFHDGRPFSATDVVHSLKRAKNHPKGKLRTRLATLAEITQRDALTLDISTLKPDPLLLKQLAFIGIVPDGTPDTIAAPTCTGPYRWQMLDPGKRVKLRRFEEYWGRLPKFETVIFDLRLSPDEAVEALLAGQSHLAELAPSLAASVDGKDDVWIFSRLSPGIYYLKLNVARGATKLAEFRAAIDHALDRDAVVEQGFHHYARVANQLVGPSSAGFVERDPAPRRDLARVRKLLGEMPAEDRADATFVCLRTYAHLCTVLQGQLAEAGIKTELNLYPGKQFYRILEDGNYEIALLMWYNNIHDAGDVYANIVHSRDPATGLGIVNYSRLSDPQLDGWIEQAMFTVDAEQRQRRLLQIADRVAELRANLPLAWEMVLYAGVRELEWEPRSDHRIAPSEIGFMAAETEQASTD